ncbi:DUF4817 domain-containing protein [Trichonephila clavipes]|uniref:DUF4817 domain-containing protein n=1 Tax=Trichonephila clavipes TaxID=2585209 RepID=A0A8X6RG81_TRICX|nr:DUF4817 domain-containing protein [Trichonephila clavipes]
MACRSTRLPPCTPAAFGKLSSPTNLHQISTGDPASMFHSKVSLLLDSHFPSGSSPIPLVFNDCSPPSCLSPREVEVVFRKLRGGKAPGLDAALNPLGELDSLDCQVIYSQFGLAIHQNDHQARRRFVKWAQTEIDVVPAFHKRILFSDEAHFWLNGYVNKQNCRIWSEANPQVYVETPLHPEKLTVWRSLWAGGIFL